MNSLRVCNLMSADEVGEAMSADIPDQDLVVVDAAEILVSEYKNAEDIPATMNDSLVSEAETENGVGDTSIALDSGEPASGNNLDGIIVNIPLALVDEQEIDTKDNEQEMDIKGKSDEPLEKLESPPKTPELASAQIPPPQEPIISQNTSIEEETALPNGVAGAPKKIVVRIKLDDGQEKSVSVVIIPPEISKRFLGGFRNKVTGLEYHNCSSQTYVNPRPHKSKDQLLSRETQTVVMATKKISTQKESKTQMTVTGCFMSEEGDKIVIPGRYQTSEEYFAIRLHATICLQSYFRRMKARARVKVLRKTKQEVDLWKQKVAAEKLEAEEREYLSKLERRNNPIVKEDFDLLYNGLEMWREEEMEKITSLPAAAQSAAKMALLQQQCKYLGSIEQLRTNASYINREKRIEKFFEMSSAPKQWVNTIVAGKGTKLPPAPTFPLNVVVETRETVRARELREVYNALKMTDVPEDTRLDILLHVKLTVQDFDSKLSKDIISLLQREGEFISRGMKSKYLEGLRQRTLNLFLQFCEDPKMNPEAARYLEVHKSIAEYSKDLFLCISCTKYLPKTSFKTNPRTQHIDRCTACTQVYSHAHSRDDRTQHRRILEDIQKKEIAGGYNSQICFLLTPDDVAYLVENVWGNCSILSHEEDIFKLTLARWDTTKAWSPWNCVLLSKDEAEVHAELGDPTLTYGAEFLKRVHQKHILARTRYISLQEQAVQATQTAAEKALHHGGGFKIKTRILSTQ